VGEQPSIFFLRGHARSGTNWIGRLLELHPRICCTGEWDFTGLQTALDRFVSRDWQVGHTEPVRSVALDAFERFCETCIRATEGRKPDVAWLGERTPKPIDPLPIAGCPLIHVQRDGRDVLVSWTHHQLKRAREGQGGLDGRMGDQVSAYQRNPDHFKEHPEELLLDESWVRQIARQWGDRSLADRRTIERGERRVHAVRYEELLEDAERERVRMYRFLGLDPDEAAPLDAGVKTTAGFASESPGSFNRKGEAGDWKNYFTGDARRWFIEEAGPALIELGYEDSIDW